MASSKHLQVRRLGDGHPARQHQQVARKMTYKALVVVVPVLGLFAMTIALHQTVTSFADSQNYELPVSFYDDGDKHLGTTFSPPPESLETMVFCAEKCKHVKAMCTDNLYSDTMSLPAPRCMFRSKTAEDDLYWNAFLKLGTNESGSNNVYVDRNAATVDLVRWAAARARERRRPVVTTRSGSAVAENSSSRCEELPFTYTNPMMQAEEFEMVVKTMALAKPETYLEWGSGKSTSFYTLLASGNVTVIDGYPPWCKKVQEEPTVNCMVEEGRLRFICERPKMRNGTIVPVKQEGRLSADFSDDVVLAVLESYVNAVDKSDQRTFDVALVDGRFRLQCALKLLPFLKPTSVLFIHDFWLRKVYHIVLDYYDVLGYARSLVVLRKKTGMSRDVEAGAYKKFMDRKYLGQDMG